MFRLKLTFPLSDASTIKKTVERAFGTPVAWRKDQALPSGVEFRVASRHPPYQAVCW